LIRLIVKKTQLGFMSVALILSATSLAAQLGPTGRITGTVDGQSVDMPLDCSSWTAEQRMVSALDDDPYGSLDSNGDGTGFSFSHFAFAGATSTDATIVLDGSSYQIGPAFRAKDDTEWAVDDDFATFDGTSGAAGDIAATLTLNCAPRSAEEQGYIGRVKGIVDGIEIDAPLSCETWDDPQATQEQTPPDNAISVELFIFRQNGQGNVTVDTGVELYQMVTFGDAFDITKDKVDFSTTYRREDDSLYDASLAFDCSNRESLTESEVLLELPSLPQAVGTGSDFTISLADIAATSGDMVVISDGSPGWLFTAMREGDEITLTAPDDPGDYIVEYLTGPDLVPTARMEFVVE